MRVIPKLLRLGIPVLAVFVVFSGIAMAEYPEKPITMYCSFSPGGTGDTSIRVLAADMEKTLGQRILIVTKAGGSGTVGLTILANDKPDGYTLCMGTTSGLMRIPLKMKVQYKPLVDFTCLYGYTMVASGTMVRPDSRYKTVKDFIEYARKNPGEVTFSSLGVGSPMHLIMEQMAMKENIKLVHVPYKGTAPSETACLGGHVDAVSAGDIHRALDGQLRAILMHTKDRYERLPDVPTTMEMGYGYYNDTVLGVFGPAGMDPAVVKKLEDALDKAQETPAWKEWLEQFGTVNVKMRSAEFTKFIEEAWDREVKIQRGLGVITEPATQPR
jgi:tripartite-type tricarboxylate transporter receptor subunit TctC